MNTKTLGDYDPDLLGFKQLSCLESGTNFVHEDYGTLIICDTNIVNIPGVPCYNANTNVLYFLNQDEWYEN